MLFLLICILFFTAEEVKGQYLVTSQQQQAIREIAYKRVEVFTRYLSILGREQDKGKINMYEKYLELSCMDQKEPLRVYNDLLPATVVERNPIFDRFINLRNYLEQLELNYSRSVQLTYHNLTPQKVCYSEYLKRYFIVVVAEREITGLYRKEEKLLENINRTFIDFYVEVPYEEKEGFSVGGIFGFELHEKEQKFSELMETDQDQNPSEFIHNFQDPVKIVSGKRKGNFKKGKFHTLKWTGGLKDDIIAVALISLEKGNSDTIRFEPVKNKNKMSLLLDENLQRGHYKFRITNISTGRYTETGRLKVKKKFLFLWVLREEEEGFKNTVNPVVTANKVFG